MRYLPYEEANKISASMELMNYAIYYAQLAHDAFEYEFPADKGTIQVYEAQETPKRGKAIGFLDKQWIFRLGIAGEKSRQVTFNVDVQGIYTALAEYSNYRTAKLRREELRHFRNWLEELEEDYGWEE